MTSPGTVRVIVIVNQPQQICQSPTENNLDTLNYLKQLTLPFLLIALDHTDGLKNGVGEARFKGADYAIESFDLSEQDLVVSLDADCTVHKDYFSALFKLYALPYAGFTLGFEHRSYDGILPKPMIIYELYLRYMKWGLSKARSPFDYYTIGSCLGTSVYYYKLSGGFPKKTGTEDFHFLNKLRKLGPIQHVPKTLVYPSSRISNRVHLGTGYFLGQYHNDQDLGITIPSCSDFGILGQVLKKLDDYYDHPSEVERWLRLHFEVFFFKSQVFSKISTVAQHSKTRESYQKKLLQVFDGFQTLRLLKYLAMKNSRSLESLIKEVGHALETNICEPSSLLHKFKQRDLELT